MRLASFDIFDTALTRTVASPCDLLLQLAIRLHGAKISESVARVLVARIDAEFRARTRQPEGEITLAEIYHELASSLSWPAATRQKAQSAELDLEFGALRAVPAIKARIAAARRAGDRIAFLSDMYLPAEFLERILRREGLFQDGDLIYVSGEMRASKAAGSLYRHLLDKLPADTKWRHTGDSLEADVLNARAAGITAEEFTDARLTPYEQIARGSGIVASPWRSQLAGAMRLARLANPESIPGQRIIWNTGVDVVGPLLFGFVDWCLAEAQKRGIRRLYFVARDGQIMHQLARLIVRERSLDIECRYLYGSRQAWHPAAIQNLGPDDLTWVLLPTHQLSLEQVFRRLALSLGDYDEFLTRSGFPAQSWGQPLRGDPRQLSELLLNPELAAAIESNSRSRRSLALAYLEQEGLFDGEPMCIVDIGWFGNLQKSLCRLLASSGQPAKVKPIGLYFGLLPSKQSNASSDLTGYLNTFDCLSWQTKTPALAMFELFTAADHGSVIGYESRCGALQPQLASARNEHALAWGLMTLQSAVNAFATAWLAQSPNDCPPSDYCRITYQGFERFFDHPSPEEAQIWGSFPFSEEQHERHFHQLVPKLRIAEVCLALASRSRRPTNWWIEGAQAACPLFILWTYLRVRKIWRRFSKTGQ